MPHPENGHSRRTAAPRPATRWTAPVITLDTWTFSLAIGPRIPPRATMRKTPHSGLALAVALFLGAAAIVAAPNAHHTASTAPSPAPEPTSSAALSREPEVQDTAAPCTDDSRRGGTCPATTDQSARIEMR